MIENSMFKNGATWLRADFHLHTIKDKEFASIENPNEFFNQFLACLEQEHIQIGVITNHNKFDKDEYTNLQRQALKKNIWILSGLELSVNDGANGIHCLIVFDNKRWICNGEDFINQFLASAFEGIANRENENTSCNYSLDALLKKLDEHKNAGRDSFVILAHVEQNSGFFQELDGGRISQFRDNELFKQFVLGFQKVRTSDEVTKWKNWLGEKLPTFVEGSDCKSIEKVGKPHTQNEVEKKTYIKIGDFNFEALKLALSDAENRVKTEIPNPSNSYIKSIKIEGGKLDGAEIALSSELNSLIGIRGSGKSSLLEILRYTLGISLPQSAADTTYKNDLIQFILGSGGKVIVELVDVHGKNYKVEKIYGQKEDMYDEHNMLQQGISIEAIFKTPIYFGQKDLSNKEDNFEADLMNRLIGAKLKSAQQNILTKQNEIHQIIFEINKMADLADKKKETELAINNAKQQIKIFQEKGIEEKLKQQTQFDKDNSHILSVKEKIKDFTAELSNIIENYQYFASNSIEKSEFNKKIFEEVEQLKTVFNIEFQKLIQIESNSKENLSKFESVIEQLNAKRENLKEEFASIKRELNSDTINPDTYLVLNRTIDLSNMKLTEIARLETKRTNLQKQLGEKLVELNNLWLEKFRSLENEVTKINNANSKLQIELIFKGRKKTFLEKIKEIFRGTGIREIAYQEICDNFTDFIEVYKSPEKVKEFINENQLGYFNQRFSEQLADLITHKVEDEIVIKYNGKLLAEHSLGQRASALILFILAQKENDVLIIDQPEDDLDNQTIYDEVIKEIKKLKGKMQFIFATHNANIPVLGDSEKIISCNFDTAKIDLLQGSIDTPEIQKSIVDIMEGGNEAFNKRKDIYGIWNVKSRGK